MGRMRIFSGAMVITKKTTAVVVSALLAGVLFGVASAPSRSETDA